MADTVEKTCVGSPKHDETDFNLKEWTIKARINRENTISRRFSASNLKSFRDEERSFRSNISISSTASSPGYSVRGEIDPSTYSFTTALKALQAKTVYTWEYISPDGGSALNPKWNDAEKYICNPLSGEVPLECLSAKTLSGRSFRSLTSRITMSAPLIYPSNHLQHLQAKSPIVEHKKEANITIQEDKKSTTRDVGTQSMPVDLSSGSPSPAHTPPIEERSIKHIKAGAGDSSTSSEKLRSSATQEEVKSTIGQEGKERKEMMRKQKMMCRCSNSSQGGCLSLKGLLRRHKHKPRSNNLSTPNFLYHINACYKK